MKYARMMVSCGKYLYVYNYGKPQQREFKKVKKIKENLGIKKKEAEQLDIFKEVAKQEESVRFSLKRKREQIYWLIEANPDMNKFVTLTFAENMQDTKKANRLFSLFIERLNYAYPNTKHLAVIEFQKRGAVHYHLLSNLSFIESKKLAKIWGHGFVKINKLKDVNNIGSYVSKYLVKEAFEGKMKGKRKYFYSKNLNRPIKIFDYKTQDALIAQYNLNCEESECKEIFENAYTGKVTFKKFEIKS